MSRRSAFYGTREEELSSIQVGAKAKPTRRRKRVATVYDAVAGHVGFNGFVSRSQLEAGITTLKPDEVLLRRVDAPTEPTEEYYNADERLKLDQRLPDTELLRAMHNYVSEYYSAHAHGEVNHNYRSLDETALLAFGVLMEEAAVEALGETGDMVLVEPEALELGLPEPAMTKHQVRGKVKPQRTPDPASNEEASSSDTVISENDRKKKRRKRWYED